MSSALEVVERSLDAKIAERAARQAEVDSIPAGAVEEKDGQVVERDLTGEETARFNAAIDAAAVLDDEIKSLQARKAQLVEMTARAAAAGQAPTMFVKQSTRESDIYADVDRSNMQNVAYGTARDLALRAVERGRGYLDDEHKNAVMATLDRPDLEEENAFELAREKHAARARLTLAASAPGYASAWKKAMTGAYMTDADRQLLGRAMTSGTGSTGGYYVPTPIDPTMIITGTGSYSPMRQLATKKTTLGNTWKGVTQAQASAVAKTEASAFTDATTTTTQVSIPVYTYGLYIPASYEAWEDIDSLAEDIGMLFADAAANLESDLFTTGNGSSTVTGVTIAISTAGSTVTASTRSAFNAVDIFAVHNALGARHRRGSNQSLAWMGNVATINRARQFGTAYSYAFLNDLGAGQPPSLLGTSLYENSSMVATITTGTKLLVFGNFAKYYIVDKIGFQTEFIPNAVDGSGVPTGQRSVVGWWRTGGTAVDPDAFRYLLL